MEREMSLKPISVEIARLILTVDLKMIKVYRRSTYCSFATSFTIYTLQRNYNIADGGRVVIFE